MDAIRSAISRARLRLLAQATLQNWGWALLAVAGASLVLVLVERLVGLSVPGWVHLVLLAAAGITGPVAAWLRRPDDAHVAAVLDDRLGLKDRLGTALFARTLGDQPLARHVVADAERATGELRVADATPIGFGRVWAAAPAVGALALALAAGLPQYDLLGFEARQQQRQAAEHAADAERDRLTEAQARVREMTQANGERPDQLADPDDVLRQLASLTPDELTNPDVRREMRAQLEDVRDRLDEAIDSQERQLRTLRNAMSQLETEERGPADRFADAMRRGDFDQAQQKLDRLAQQHETGELSEGDRELLGRQFREMSEQLGDIADQARQQHEQTREQMRDELREQGLSEDQLDELERRDFERDAVEEALREQYEQQARDQARDRDSEDPQGHEDQDQDTRDHDAQDPEQEQGEDADESEDQHRDQHRDEQQDQQQDRADQAGDEESRQQQARERAQRQADRTQQQRREADRHEQTAAQCEGLGQCMGGMADAAGDGDPGAFQQEAWEAQRQLSELQEEEGELDRLSSAREQVGQAEDALDGAEQPDQQPGEAGPADQQVADASGAGEQGAGDGGEGEQAGDGGGVGGQEGGAGAAGSPYAEADQPWDYETRTEHAPRAGRGRVIASWMSEGEAETGEAQRGFDEAVTEARDDADRAVAEDRVPHRYHGSIRRYFEQLPESVEEE